jgi:C-terminal processing protease CtpA/Prc
MVRRDHVMRTLLATVLIGSVARAGEPAEKAISAADLKADLAELYGKLKVSHYDLYARRPKAEYDALFESMLAGFTRPLSLEDAHVRFQKFLAYGRVAHSRTDGFLGKYSAYRDKGGKALPLGLRIVKGRAYVVEDQSSSSRISLGDQLLALNAVPMKRWLDRLRAYVAADDEYMLHTLLEFDLPALLWLEAGSQESFAATVRSSGGKVFETRIQARSREEMRAATKPLDTLDLDWNKREWKMMPDRVAYLRPGPFYNNEPGATDMWDARSFASFIDGAFTGMLEANARALVIDLRNNAGGDNSFSDRMVSWFADEPYRFVSEFRIRVSQAAIDSNQKRLDRAPDATSSKLAAAYRGRKLGEVIEFETPFACPRTGKRFEGKVLLLVNRHSYSNTVMVAALAQDFGFATVVGEETSDLSTTYGAMEQFALTRTGIAIGFPKAYIIRPSGATTPRGVVPDVAIAAPVIERKDDPMLQRALAVATEDTSKRRRALSPKIAEALARHPPCANDQPSGER